MTLKPGDIVPPTTLFEMGEEGPVPVSSEDIFKVKKVAVFGVPGAYTRTCSARHLPGFVYNADAIKARGVDDIVCLSVNDAWVMSAWGEVHGATGKVRMVGDGNLEFTRFAGLEVDLSAKGYGPRMKRFSALIDDATVTHVHFEKEGFGETSAERLMEDL